MPADCMRGAGSGRVAPHFSWRLISLISCRKPIEISRRSRKISVIGIPRVDRFSGEREQEKIKKWCL